MELNSHFNGLRSAIEPDSDAVSIAKASHEELRKKIKGDEELSQANPDSYLAGSYARDTAINNIKDVDVIVLIDLDQTTTEPEVVLAWVQGRLQEYYENVRLQGRSIQVTTDSDFQLDVVPSVAVSHRDGAIWIPDRDAKKWVTSHPKGQINFGVKNNANTEGFYKPIVKIMKSWKDRIGNEDAKIKSYILENIIGMSLTSKPDSYAKAVYTTFKFIVNSYSMYETTGVVPKIPDQGYPSVNVAKRWKFQEFLAFMAEAKKSMLAAELALNSKDEAESARLWRSLFGPKFKPKE